MNGPGYSQTNIGKRRNGTPKRFTASARPNPTVMKGMKIGASTLLTMCAAHFIAGFSPRELKKRFFTSDFEATYRDEPVEISYRLDFNGDRAENIEVETYCDVEESVTGDLTTAKQESLSLINGFLERYCIVPAGDDDAEWRDERVKALYYERKYGPVR